MLDPHWDAIAYDLRSAKPETKFFLIKLLQLHGWKQPITQRVKDLAKAVGVWDRHVTIGVEELEDHGYLYAQKIRPAKDAPAKTLTLTCPPDARYQGTNKRGSVAPTVPPPHHGALINALLDQRNSGINKRKSIHTKDRTLTEPNDFSPDELTVTHKVLLITLLRYADASGVVRELGMKDLEYLTGMNRSRLDNQIAGLKRLGLIRYNYPGITNAKLFGASKGAFILDLTHRQYGRAARTALALISQSVGSSLGSNEADDIAAIAQACPPDGDTGSLIGLSKAIEVHRDTRTARAVTKVTRSRAGFWRSHQHQHHPAIEQSIRYLAESETVIPRTWLFPFFSAPFKALEAKETRWHFQMRLYDLASTLLSEHWERLSAGQHIPLEAGSGHWIALQRFIRPHELMPDDIVMHTGRTRRELFLRYVWATALRIAKQWHRTTSPLGFHETGMTFVILPHAFEKKTKTHRRGSSLLCYYPERPTQPGTSVFTIQPNSNRVQLAMEKIPELNIPRKELIEIGLAEDRKEPDSFDWKKQYEK